MHNIISKFEKVSYEQFVNDLIATNDKFKTYSNDELFCMYNAIKIPKRATSKSAGYDIYLPFNINLKKFDSIIIPTGIRCKIKDDYVLQVYPKSGLGFKYGMRLSNTVGIIDADYYDSDNEGHIMIKINNDSLLSSDIIIESGKGFCQGVFTQYGIAEDDDCNEIRNGGFGSTNN